MEIHTRARRRKNRRRLGYDPGQIPTSMTKCSVKHLLLVVLLACIACAAGTDPLSAQSQPKFVDEVGREVVFSFPPKRIVSLAPNITEILFSLGLDTEIVGVSALSNYPEAAQRKAKVGSYVTPDFEKIVSLKPDLIVATGVGNTREVVDRLDKLGFPSYVIFPKNIDGVLKSIEHLGQVLDREKEAAWVVEGMKKRRERVVERIKGIPRPKVFLLVGESPIVTVGKGSFADDLIRLAGGDNIAGNQREMYPRWGMEEVLQRSPEVILISAMNPRGDYQKVLQEWSRWKSLPAVKQGRIYTVDSDVVDRPSPRIIDGLEAIARILHPEVFGHPSPSP
jgi:iron complex transport system substrate-binding protein